MQEWRKDILSHNLSIRESIEKSTISDIEIKSLNIIEKAFKDGRINERVLKKTKDVIFNK